MYVCVCVRACVHACVIIKIPAVFVNLIYLKTGALKLLYDK